jgi:GDPmannose 4,6-dehydratase
VTTCAAVTDRRALITGLTGQDGLYLAEELLAEGTEVVGLVRPGSRAPLPETVADVPLVEADLRDPPALRRAVADVAPDELYHLAAPTFVPDSWADPTDTVEAIAVGTSALLAAALAQEPRPRVWVAGSAEVFGDSGEHPQNERSPMRPRTPYGVAKLAAHGLVGTLRGHHGLFACSGLTFNHESPRRPARFLPRKVTRAAAAIRLGLEDHVVLGDLDAVRDWSHAQDVVRAAVLALRHDVPGDYVVASGQGRTVRELVDVAFTHAGLDPEDHVRVDLGLVRPPERTPPVGDPTRAREVLGWVPAWSFEALIGAMVDADVAELAARAG